MDILVYELEAGASAQPGIISPPVGGRPGRLETLLRAWAQRLSPVRPAA